MATSEITNLTNVKQLADGSSAGTCMGQSATDKVAFYGGTPTAQQTVTLTTVTAVATTVFSAAYTGMWAFSSSTVAKTYRTRINQLIVDVTAIKTALGSTKLNLVA
jgi:hypothetical protein